MTVARTGTDASWPRRRGTCWGRGGRGRHGTSKEVRGRRQAVALGPDAKVVVVASRRSRPRFGFGGVGVTGRGRGHGRCCCCPASRLLVHVPRLDAEDVAARWGAGRGRHGVGVTAWCRGSGARTARHGRGRCRHRERRADRWRSWCHGSIASGRGHGAVVGGFGVVVLCDVRGELVGEATQRKGRGRHGVAGLGSCSTRRDQRRGGGARGLE